MAQENEMGSTANFGSSVRAWREGRGLSVRKLASTVGISPTYLSRMERGDLPPPKAPKVIAIAEALQLDRDVLLALAGKVGPEHTTSEAAVEAQATEMIRSLGDGSFQLPVGAATGTVNEFMSHFGALEASKGENDFVQLLVKLRVFISVVRMFRGVLIPAASSMPELSKSLPDMTATMQKMFGPLLTASMPQLNQLDELLKKVLEKRRE